MSAWYSMRGSGHFFHSCLLYKASNGSGSPPWWLVHETLVESVRASTGEVLEGGNTHLQPVGFYSKYFVYKTVIWTGKKCKKGPSHLSWHWLNVSWQNIYLLGGHIFMSDSCRMRFIFYVKCVILGTGQRRSAEKLPFIIPLLSHTKSGGALLRRCAFMQPPPTPIEVTSLNVPWRGSVASWWEEGERLKATAKVRVIKKMLLMLFVMQRTIWRCHFTHLLHLST